MTTRKMLLDRLPADFHARLENWGEVMRSRPHYAVLPTYEVCRRLAKRTGQGAWEGEEYVRELDERDAGLIEAAWRNSVYRMLHQRRDILRAHYVTRSYWLATCRALGLRTREYDDVLVRAVGNFEDFVARYATPLLCIIRPKTDRLPSNDVTRCPQADAARPEETSPEPMAGAFALLRCRIVAPLNCLQSPSG
ncbi:hypothetical protein [Bordetella bronchiseptica]|uniref:hypothetical protein n=1 Tax=Bordetella bronchiseptica TaxID=518 RepID=UPI001E30DCA5|nr:hypothetical protein [Bordetella bronchiseptica]